jgi:hypothetical protein
MVKEKWRKEGKDGGNKGAWMKIMEKMRSCMGKIEKKKRGRGRNDGEKKKNGRLAPA